MPVKACQTKILVDQFDFSGDTNGVSIDAQVKQIEYAVLQSCQQLRIPGNPSASFEHNGYWSGPGAGALEYELNARLGIEAQCKAGIVLDTGAAIPVAYVLNSTYNQQLKYMAPIEGLLQINGMWPAGNDKMVRGYQVHYGLVNATGALSTVDFGAAATAAGSKAFLFVQAKVGTITAGAVKVQSSAASNFSSPTDRGTFTFSGLGAFEVDLSGTLGRYVRMNVTDLGGATSFTILGVVCSFGKTF
jgi:hypothetical protein